MRLEKSIKTRRTKVLGWYSIKCTDSPAWPVCKLEQIQLSLDGVQECIPNNPPPWLHNERAECHRPAVAQQLWGFAVIRNLDTSIHYLQRGMNIISQNMIKTVIRLITGWYDLHSGDRFKTFKLRFLSPRHQPTPHPQILAPPSSCDSCEPLVATPAGRCSSLARRLFHFHSDCITAFVDEAHN